MRPKYFIKKQGPKGFWALALRYDPKRKEVMIAGYESFSSRAHQIFLDHFGVPEKKVRTKVLGHRRQWFAKHITQTVWDHALESLRASFVLTPTRSFHRLAR